MTSVLLLQLLCFIPLYLWPLPSGRPSTEVTLNPSSRPMSILHLGSWRGSSSTETAFKRLRDPVRDKDYQAPRRDQFPSQEAGSTLGINKATILLCASVFLMGQMLNLASSPAFQHTITNKTQTLGMTEWNAGGWPLYFQACGLTV